MAKVMNTSKCSGMYFSKLHRGDLFLFNGQNYMRILDVHHYNAICFETAEAAIIVGDPVVIRLTQAITLEND